MPSPEHPKQEDSPKFSSQKIYTIAVLTFCAAGVLWMFSQSIFASDFLPHQYCLAGNRKLLWTFAVTDLTIGVSYLVIAGAIVWLLRQAKGKLPFAGIMWAFGVFITSCGATHFLDVVTLWKPVYGLFAVVKILTAVASAGTCFVLIFCARTILNFALEKSDIALLRGNERFRALVQAAPMAVIGADIEGLVTTWNPSAERIFGWKKEEVLGKFAKSIPPDKKEEVLQLLARTRAGQVTTGFESIRVTRDGERLPVSISTAPIYDETGRLAGIMVTQEDIRERKRIERELQEKSATLAAVTHALNVFLESGDWSTASQHLLSFALRETQSEYGFLGVVLEGPVLRVLAHGGIQWDERLSGEPYESMKKQYLNEGYFEVSHGENLLGEVINKGKTIVCNELSGDPRSKGVPAGHPPLHAFLGVPIFKGGDIVGLIAVANRPGGYAGDELLPLETMSQATGVLYDNYRQSLQRARLERERANLESEFRQAQKMEVLGRLAGGIAHDFNNMLMVLTVSSELLQNYLPPKSPATPYLDQIQRTTERATAITKQLLAFSRKQLIEVRPTDLHEVLTESEFMLPRLLGSDVELTFQHEASCSWIRADAGQLEQVIANLAINARDAMPGGGKLTISTRNSDTLPADISWRPGGVHPTSWLVLEVRDTGCGMDEQTRNHIFEPFFTTKQVGKGSGLGLSTVYGVVHQFEGYIDVESQRGAGTCFRLYFPVCEAAGAQKPSVAIAAEPRATEEAQALTIVLADDETALRIPLAEFLRIAGHHVLDSHDPLDVLEMARRHNGCIDVLLTDIVMPGLRGTELARQVAELHPGIQVIYMSGYAEGFPETQIPPEATFLQKPFRFATLLEQLKLIQRKS
ncbi:MAG TPA: PAS domain S-box protein [Candidatus Acidoferrum sp.]|nr:PAS domain S-box protein [Candidatus Acidoferrum sp.]